MWIMSIVPLQGEIWKDVHWTGGFFQVSQLGRVRRTNGGKLQKKLCQIIPTRIYEAGYPTASICFNGKKYSKGVHVLIAEAFIGPRPEGMQVNHKDGVKTNFSPDNLEYCTPLENMRHGFRLGLIKPPPSEYPHGVRPSSCSSKHKGVCRLPSGKWIAQVWHRGKHNKLGTFVDELDAAEVASVARQVLRQSENIC